MHALSFRNGLSMRAAAPANRTAPAPRLAASRRPARARAVAPCAAFAPPPVASTKAAFLKSYPRPISAVYDTVIQELLVQQHFMRYAIKYEYNEVFALGVVSVFDQILEQVPEKERNAIFDAYVKALNEDPATYRKDAVAMEEAASALSGPPSTAGDSAVSKALAKVAAKSADGSFSYNRFFAIGLFRLLEITGAKEPSALEGLVKAVGVKPESVNKDLTLYKGILSKLSSAKELMKEFLEREKRKQAERDAERKARAEKDPAAEAPTPPAPEGNI